ncbi:MAG TPA: hypothetical protein VJI96_00820 [Candidatus Andersenbacteria bacterium]|nr:hypothetical protein [Candidatus Andersenbacteria bacterium]
MRFLLGKTVIVCLFLFAIIASGDNASAQSMRQYGAGFDVPPQALLNPYTGQVAAIRPGYPVYMIGGYGFGGSATQIITPARGQWRTGMHLHFDRRHGRCRR